MTIEKAKESYLERNNFTEMSPKAVFFDMDGVLFDSMPHHSVAWVKAMNESGLEFSEHEAYMNEGQTGTATINSVFVLKNGREATEEEKQEIYKLKAHYFEKLNAPETIPYVFDLLKKIKKKGYQLFVVTGSAQPSLLHSLQDHFPDIFLKENIISAFDVTRGKPHPEPYLKALQRAGLEPCEALVVENAPLGVKSSSAARIFTIGVNTGPLDTNVLYENGADLVLDSMHELFEKWDDFGF